MPRKPLRPCNTPRCRGLTRDGSCEVCGARAGSCGWRGHNKTRTQRGYGNDWLRLRKRKLQANPLCEECERKAETSGRLTVALAEQVHHKTPFNGVNDPLRLDWNNLEALCRACHRAKTP